MSTSSLVLSLIGSGVLGAVLTSAISVSHERAERQRDRMLEAAEAFLQAFDEAELGLLDARDKASEFISYNVELEKSFRNLRGDVNKTSSASADAALARAALACTDLCKFRLSSPPDDSTRAETYERVVAAEAELEEYDGPDVDIVRRFRAALVEARRHPALLRQAIESVLALNDFEHRLYARVPRLVVLFSRRDNGVVASAKQIFDRFGVARESFPDFEDERSVRDFNQALISMRQAVSKFSDSVASRTSRRRP